MKRSISSEANNKKSLSTMPHVKRPKPLGLLQQEDLAPLLSPFNKTKDNPLIFFLNYGL
jgi:hypothetical protein